MRTCKYIANLVSILTRSPLTSACLKATLGCFTASLDRRSWRAVNDAVSEFSLQRLKVFRISFRTTVFLEQTLTCFMHFRHDWIPKRLRHRTLRAVRKPYRLTVVRTL